MQRSSAEQARRRSLFSRAWGESYHQRRISRRSRNGGRGIGWDLQYRSSFPVKLTSKGWIGFSFTPHSDPLFSGEIKFDDRSFLPGKTTEELSTHSGAVLEMVGESCLMAWFSGYELEALFHRPLTCPQWSPMPPPRPMAGGKPAGLQEDTFLNKAKNWEIENLRETRKNRWQSLVALVTKKSALNHS